MTEPDAPPLTVRQRRDDRGPAEGRVVLTVVGELDASTVATFDAVLAAELGDPEVTDVVVDAAGLDFIDSVGIRSLLVAHRAIEARGGQFTLDPASPTVRRVLRLAGVAGLLAPRSPARPDGDAA